MDIQKIKSRRAVILIIGGVLILLAVFKAGEATGYRKAMFSYRWGENYQRIFGGPQMMFLGMFSSPRGGGFMNAHGASGEVLKTEWDTIVIKGEDGNERSVKISSSTSIRKRTSDIFLMDIKERDNLVIIGDPGEDGEIRAKFIRVFEKTE